MRALALVGRAGRDRRLRRRRRGGNGAASATSTPPATPPIQGQPGSEVPASGPPLGFPVFATKNTTRVAGGDAIADAAGVALATYPARTAESRPTAVVLAEVRAWQTGIAASVLAARPSARPILFADGNTIPAATKAALDALQPTGSKEAGGAPGDPRGDEEGARRAPRQHNTPAAASQAALAAAVDRLQTAAAGSGVERGGHRQRRGPARTARCHHQLGRESGNPILWVTATGVHRRPRRR